MVNHRPSHLTSLTVVKECRLIKMGSVHTGERSLAVLRWIRSVLATEKATSIWEVAVEILPKHVRVRGRGLSSMRRLRRGRSCQHRRKQCRSGY